MTEWLILKFFTSLPFHIKLKTQLLMLPEETWLLKKDAVVRALQPKISCNYRILPLENSESLERNCLAYN